MHRRLPTHLSRMCSPIRGLCSVFCGLVALASAASARAEVPAHAPLADAASPGPALASELTEGPLLELRGHLALGEAERLGVSIEPAVSYRWRRFEFGIGVQLLGLWASDDLPLGSTYPERSYRDLTLLPRAELGLQSQNGFWRAQLTAGYGPTWMSADGGSPPLPAVQRSVWSYGAGIGLAAGVFHAEVQWFGYLRHAEAGYTIAAGEGSADELGGAGAVTSLGVAFPIEI